MQPSTAWILENFKDISLCQMADALGPAIPLETEIRPINSRFRIVGPAVTILCSPDDNLTIHHALHNAVSGDVLVVKSGENCNAGLWGELMTLAAKMRNLGGTIIDGACRDQIQISDLEYPVFSRTVSPRRADKQRYGQINVTISCGSLTVDPGDLIIADADGMMAVPSSRIKEAARLAHNVAQREAEIEDQIRSGRTIFEILELGRQISRQ